MLTAGAWVIGFLCGWYIRNTKAGNFIHSWMSKDK